MRIVVQMTSLVLMYRCMAAVWQEDWLPISTDGVRGGATVELLTSEVKKSMIKVVSHMLYYLPAQATLATVRVWALLKPKQDHYTKRHDLRSLLLC